MLRFLAGTCTCVLGCACSELHVRPSKRVCRVDLICMTDDKINTDFYQPENLQNFQTEFTLNTVINKLKQQGLYGEFSNI